MAVLNLLAASLNVNPPKGMWETLLGLFASIGNYGWRIILFTVILKLLLSPLDFFQKYKMRKNQRITKALEPEIERLKKQYGNNKQAFQQEQMRLQRSSGFSYLSSCIPMIITLVVFFTFFAGMRNISQYEEFKQYVGIYEKYSEQYTVLTGIDMPGVDAPEKYDGKAFDALIEAEYEKDAGQFMKGGTNVYLVFEENGGSFKELYGKKLKYDKYLYDLWELIKGKDTFTEEQKQGIVDKLNEDTADNKRLLADMGRDEYETFAQVEEDYNKIRGELDGLDTAAGENGVLLGIAEQSCALAAAYYYDDNNSRFLWINSLWAADAPWAEAIPNFDTFRKNVSKYFNDNAGKLDSAVLKNLDRKATYDSVMSQIREKDTVKGANGYFILAILAVGFSLLSQLVMTRQQKKSGQANAQGGTMKVMMFIMPAMTGVFALMYTASFAIYMITNSVMSLLINLLTTAILGGISMRKDKEMRSETGVVKYGRKDPNDNKRK